MTALLVALGAAVGGPARYVAGHYLDRRLPWGTLLVNVLGSFTLGLLVGSDLSDRWYALLGIGFCGAFTTYSAFAVQTHERGPALGTTYAVLTIGLGLGAAFLGFALA